MTTKLAHAYNFINEIKHGSEAKIGNGENKTNCNETWVKRKLDAKLSKIGYKW